MKNEFINCKPTKIKIKIMAILIKTATTLILIEFFIPRDNRILISKMIKTETKSK